MMSQSKANVGYALLDAEGGVVAGDEVFDRWLAGRTLSELLPEMEPRCLETINRRLKFCATTSHSTVADVELRELEGERLDRWILRIAERATPETGPGYRDAVTNLPDRRALAMHRENLIRDADGKLPHAVVFLDLDNFKQVNDSLGHAAGDLVLGLLAERWRKSLRGGDLIVRYGGDEFVVLLTGVRTHGDLEPIISRLRATTSAPLEINGHEIKLSVSVGVAFATEAATSLEELLDTADRAMYADKRRNAQAGQF